MKEAQRTAQMIQNFHPRLATPRGCHFRYHVVHDPIRRHGERGALGAHLQGVDLVGRVEPWHAEAAHAEGGEEDEEEGRCHGAVLEGIGWVGDGESQHDGDDYPACAAGECGCHHHAAAAVALDYEVGEDGEDEVVYGAGCGEDTCSGVVLVKVSVKTCGVENFTGECRIRGRG